MRVVSQNGIFDFPYEQIVVYRDENYIASVMCSNASKRDILAQYSTEEKAEMAIGMLHNTYKDSLWTDSIYDSNAQATVPYINRSNSVFQFPSDDEVLE